ncbi:hypothetical protein AB833_04990 [Chromatiales bacterium (ex Bugula neritina AB1)]|nr:hypothetical protein AB833_04990 [Chromatiales bacterium (ex Bugula neritina AB1)]
MAKMPHQIPNANLTLKRGSFGRGTGAYTIKLGNAVIATAQSMTEANDKPVVMALGTGQAHAGHDVTHTILQPGGRSPQAGPQAPPPPPPPPVLTIDYTEVKWDYSLGSSPELRLRSRTGQMVKVEQEGRVVLEGRLKSVQQKKPMPDVWSMDLTNTKRM